MLPREFPPRSTVYGYFRRFWQDGIWSTIQATLLMAAQEQVGLEASPTAGIIYSQSVSTTEAGVTSGFDAGKKVSGRKRHLLTHTLDLSLRLIVHPANLQDRDGLRLVCSRISTAFPSPAAPVRRCRLSGRDRLVCCSARAAAARDRQAPALRRGVALAAAALGDRAYVRLARPQSPARQRLRTADRYNNSHGRARHHPDVYPQTGKPLINDPNSEKALSPGLDRSHGH